VLARLGYLPERWRKGGDSDGLHDITLTQNKIIEIEGHGFDC
jgi:hypothetical protein